MALMEVSPTYRAFRIRLVAELARHSPVEHTNLEDRDVEKIWYLRPKPGRGCIPIR